MERGARIQEQGKLSQYPWKLFRVPTSYNISKPSVFIRMQRRRPANDFSSFDATVCGESWPKRVSLELDRSIG